MANTDAPFGMIPIRHRNGAAYNGAGNWYYKPATDTTALFVGDAVVKSGTSNTAQVEFPGVGTFQAGTLPAITRVTAGDSNAITGVVMAIGAKPANLSQHEAPSLVENLIFVADDPDLTFIIQDDGGGTPAATDVGLNAVLIFTHAGDTTTGRSKMEMDYGTSDAPAADASNQLTIQRLYPAVDNELGDYAVWEVKINNHTEAHGAVGL